MHSETIATAETAQLLLREIGKPHLLRYFSDRLNSGLNLPTRPQLIRAYAQLAGADAKELLKQIITNSEELPISQSMAIEMLADLELAGPGRTFIDVIQVITTHLDNPASQVLSAAASALVKLDVQRSTNKLRNLLAQGKLDPSIENDVRRFIQNVVATSVDQIIPPIPEHLFFERQAMLQAIRNALETEEGSRIADIVALTGIPGIGKTTLAARYARQAPFDLIFWFSARHQSDEADFLGRLAQQIDLQRPGTVSDIFYDSLNESFNLESTVQQLITFLKEYTSLLVIDDFDASQHQRDLGRLIESLINRIPKMRCLITSRRPPSHLKSEPIALDILSDDGTMQFIRQKMAERNVEYSSELAEQILDLSGGLPLAIQLAVQSLAVYGQLPRKRDQHLVLRELLNQTVDGFSQQQHRFLEILTYFEDGIAPNDSQFLGILKQEGIEFNQNDMQALIDSALITERPDGRIDVSHLLIREYFQQTADQRTRLRTTRAVGEYYLGQGNMLQAASHFALAGDSDEVIQIIRRSLSTLINQGHAGETLRLLSEEVSDIDERTRLNMLRLILIGELTILIGDYQEALRAYEAALQIATTLKEQGVEADIYNSLGRIYTSQGKYQDALYAYNLSLERRQKDDDVGISQTLNNMGGVYQYMGEWERATTVYRQSLALKERTGDYHGVALTLNNLGLIYANQGDLNTALEAYQKSFEYFESLEDVLGLANTRSNLGNLYLRRGEIDSAEALFRQALETLELVGDKLGSSNTIASLGEISIRKGDLAQALEYYKQALAYRQEVGDIHGTASALSNLGAIYMQRGEWEQAITLSDQSLVLRKAIGDVRGIAQTYSNLGLIYVNRGDFDEAITVFQQSLRSLQEIGDIYGTGLIFRNLGQVYAEIDKLEDAITAYHSALEIFKMIGDLRSWGITKAYLGILLQQTGNAAEAAHNLAEALLSLQAIHAPEATQIADYLVRLLGSADEVVKYLTSINNANEIDLLQLNDLLAQTTGVDKVKENNVSGAIVTGEETVAAGERSIAIGGNFSESIIITGDNNIITESTTTYSEKYNSLRELVDQTLQRR